MHIFPRSQPVNRPQPALKPQPPEPATQLRSGLLGPQSFVSNVRPRSKLVATRSGGPSSFASFATESDPVISYTAREWQAKLDAERQRADAERQRAEAAETRLREMEIALMGSATSVLNESSSK